jgi:hypothetical protein
MQKSILKFLIAVSTLFCLNCGFIFSEKKVELQHLWSPNQEREAILKKNESNYTYLTTRSNGKTIEFRYPIYTDTNWFGDKLTDFISRYPARKWINNRVFFVGFNENYKTSKDIILIKNSSSKTIEQILIYPLNMYFVYNIQPNEIVEIPAAWYDDYSRNYSNRCHISAEGYFSDGKRLVEYRFKNQTIEPDKEECGSVEVVVTDESIEFNSLIKKQ